MNVPRTAPLDPITMSVTLYRFSSIATEMTVALSNAAFSALLSLTNDFSCAIYDARGRQLAAVDALPIHTNSMHLFLDEIGRTFGGDIHEGDVVACNHPYRGNTHIGDLLVVTPVFSRGRHVLCVAAKAHQLDVGAPVPTSANPAATSIWQEGIMIPPVKLYDRRVKRHDVIDFHLANVRGCRGVSAARIAAGTARSLPAEPRAGADGLVAAIWY